MKIKAYDDDQIQFGGGGDSGSGPEHDDYSEGSDADSGSVNGND